MTKFKDTSLNILGTPYQIKFINNDDEAKNYPHLDYLSDGICLTDSCIILVRTYDNKDEIAPTEEEGGSISLENYVKRCLRHEILHAYLNESGLKSQCSIYNGPWSRNETMIDWFAIMSPKIFKSYKELNLL